MIIKEIRNLTHREFESRIFQRRGVGRKLFEFTNNELITFLCY
jgi:hypothetical protein